MIEFRHNFVPTIFDYGHKFSTDHFHECTGNYRQHPLEFKRALTALSLEPGASVARIAREHGGNANQVFSWQRRYQQGRLGVPALLRDDGLLLVVLAPTAPAPSNTSSHANGIIVLELGDFLSLHHNLFLEHFLTMVFKIWHDLLRQKTKWHG